MRTTGFLSMVYLVSAICVQAQAGEKQVVRVGAYENPPKVFTTADGETVGLFPDLLKQIAAEEGWTLQYVHGSWNECLQRLEDGEIDMMPDFAISPERARRFVFSTEPVFFNWGKVYAPKAKPIESLLDLEGKTIAVMRGCIHAEGPDGIASLLKRFGILSRFVEVDSYAAVFQSLDENKVDAGVVNRLFGQQYADSFDVASTSIIFNPCQLTFAYSKGNPQTPDLRQRVDSRLKAMKADRDSHFYRTIDRYVLGLSPRAVHAKPGVGRIVYLTAAEKAWIREHPVIHLGIDPEFAPYEFIDDNGRYGGIASGYIEILNKRLGLNMKIVPGLGWQEAIHGVETGKVDALPCVGMTEQRKVDLAYSRPYITFQRVIIMHADAPFISDVCEIDGMTVGVQTASSHEAYLQESNRRIDLVPFPQFQDALKALSRGKIDAVVGNLACASYWIRKLNLSNLKVATSIPDDNDKLYFAIRRDWPELVGILNKGLASIDAAEAEDIRRPWVSVQFDSGIDARTVLLWLGGILFATATIVGIMTVWNRKLKREIRRRKEAEHSRDALTHMIVHDLNNQLCSISGCAELMLHDSAKVGPPSNGDRFYVEQMQKSASEMSSLIESILAVAKLESGNLLVSMAPVNVATMLKDICGQFAALAEDKGIVLEAADDANEMAALADPQLLSRILQNLVANSLRYAGQGSHVTCFARPHGGKVAIGVQDDGPGIPAKYHDKVFDKYFRVENSKETRILASGLGLSFCKMATEAMGGTICVQTPTEGKGVIFLAELDASSRAEPVSPRRPSEPETGFRIGPSS